MSEWTASLCAWTCLFLMKVTSVHALCNSLFIFHSSVPRHQKGSIFFFSLAPLPSRLYRSVHSLHLGHITFTYWILSVSRRRGGKENGGEVSCGVNYKKNFIFPHSAGRHMHYGFTATEAMNLFGGEFVPWAWRLCFFWKFLIKYT